MAAELKLPATVYVKWEEGSDGTAYLIADEDATSLLENGARNIGVYSLAQVKRGKLGPSWEK